MYYVRIFYRTRRSIILVEEHKAEGDPGINSTIMELIPSRGFIVRKRLTRKTLNALRENNSFETIYHYYNRNKQAIMGRKEIREHLTRSKPWGKFDRLGKPQILIYEP